MTKCKELPLDDIVTMIDYRGKTPKKSTSGIPLITAKIIKNGRIYTPTEFISEDEYVERMTRGFPQIGDILITTEAPLGEVAELRDAHVAMGQRIITMHANKNLICGKYLKYYLLSHEGQSKLRQRESGTTVTGIKQAELRKVLIPLPPLYVQQRISRILDTLDDKIELNEKINQNLEAQAQAIFKSWFIDFEPFKNGKFIDSELGRIPEGWKVESIYSISEVIYGAPFSSNLFNNKQLGTPIIRIRDLPNEASNTYTTESHPKGYLIKQGDIVVGMDGEFKAYLWGGDNAWLNQRICVFKSKLNVSTAFVMFSIVPLLNEVESSELATTVIHLGKNDIDRFKIILPKLNILKEFNRISIPIFDAIIKNKRESQRLAQLRDTLLPKLMSGEIDVSGVVV